MRYTASDGSVWNIYREDAPWRRGFDWDYYHVDYDGPGDDRHGSARSADEARANIEDWIDENP